ncbi:MAG: DUF5683 domain-containing protein [Ferruginibacter sp.]
MLSIIKKIIVAFICFFCCTQIYAQQDSIVITNSGNIVSDNPIEKIKDTVPKYSPRKAIIHSAIIPGWGQVTNKKVWKVPVVYAALGITTYLFFRNLKQYKDSKNAYILATDGDPANDFQIKEPYFSVKDQPDRIRTFRNQVRQNVDYSALFFLVFWALNVADAAVDAHLKTFDVNDNLSLQIKGGYSPMANTNGISLLMHIGK